MRINKSVAGRACSRINNALATVTKIMSLYNYLALTTRPSRTISAEDFGQCPSGLGVGNTARFKQSAP
jgi:hypothetical protein